MQIQLNGEVFHLLDNRTVCDLITELGLKGKRLAVECNGEVIMRGEYANCVLAEGDCVELVQAIGGG